MARNIVFAKVLNARPEWAVPIYGICRKISGQDQFRCYSQRSTDRPYGRSLIELPLFTQEFKTCVPNSLRFLYFFYS